MRRQRIAAWGAALVAALTGGCARHTEPVSTPRPSTRPAERGFEALWQASLDVLERYHFDIELADRRAGRITTGRATGRQWFEFWREGTGPEHLLENSLHTIYRRVEVRIRPAGRDRRRYRPVVRVYVSRSNRGQVQVTNTSEAYSLFTQPPLGSTAREALVLDSAGRPSAAEAETPGPQRPAPPGITPLGRDHGMEARMWAEIRRRAGGG